MFCIILIMNKFLRRIFEKIGQTIPAIPSDAVAKNKATIPPPDFIASAIYPGLNIGFSSASIPIINAFIKLLNTSVHYASAGAVNFQTFRNNNFTFDASQAPSVDQRNLMNLSKLVYTTLLNYGQPYKQALTGQQISSMVDRILASNFYQGLSQLNPTGTLATKIPGNIKTTINDYLIQLKSINPIQR